MTLLKVGTTVRIIEDDGTVVSDEFMPPFHGEVGVICRIVTKAEKFPVGETPLDPGYLVAIPRRGIDWFWREELIAMNNRRRKTA